MMSNKSLGSCILAACLSLMAASNAVGQSESAYMPHVGDVQPFQQADLSNFGSGPKGSQPKASPQVNRDRSEKFHTDRQSVQDALDLLDDNHPTSLDQAVAIIGTTRDALREALS